MEQAFIIMQIGNKQLDAVCEQAIVPALKACGFDPKRVDKHNSGNLLKSEIIAFIETAGIIIADVTNERPNCYLEIGYAMGINKFQQLILTAREDHDHSSHNYKVTGPKIHFDLSGYDICFWDQNKLEQFREELEKRIRRRKLIMSSTGSSPSSPWKDEWLRAQQTAAQKGLANVGRKAFMEVQFSVQDSKLKKHQTELLQAMERAVIHTFGWPIGIVMNTPDFKPRPTTDGIRAEVAINESGRRSYDYWALRKEGDFYLLKSLSEDTRGAEEEIFFDTRIVRITETLLFCARLYNILGTDAAEFISMRFTHGGIVGRRLTAANPARYMLRQYVSSSNDIATDIQTKLSQIESELVSVVKNVAEPLFVIFDFFELSDDVYEDIVNNFVAGRLP
jgi:hypothetical protein